MSLIISLIVPTYNGLNKLQTLIPFLRAVEQGPDEIIVVVDGSVDGSGEFLRNHTGDLPIKILETTNQGRSKARNAGAKIATGSHLIFMDDDAMLNPDCFTYIRSVHLESYPNRVVTFYPKLYPPSGNWFHTYRLARDEANRQAFGTGLVSISYEKFSFTSFLLVIPAELFLHLGGFDDRLTDSEDYDLGMKLLGVGREIICDLNLEAYHNDVQDLTKAIQRQVQYYLARNEVLKIHPEYHAYMPGFFEWKKRRRWDGLRKVVFSNIRLWNWLLANHLIPGRTVRSKLTDALLYTHSILKLRE